jgi:hypothetical protein
MALLKKSYIDDVPLHIADPDASGITKCTHNDWEALRDSERDGMRERVHIYVRPPLCPTCKAKKSPLVGGKCESCNPPLSEELVQRYADDSVPMTTMGKSPFNQRIMFAP